MSDSKFEELIERQLTSAGFEFQREPAIAGLSPDFLVKGPHGELVIVELKLWNPRGGNTARAIEQVKLYEKATGADRVFLVLPEASKNTDRRAMRGFCVSVVLTA